MKTRLAAKTGPDLAARVAGRLLVAATEEFHDVGDQRWLVYTPPEKKSLFGRLLQAESWEMRPQASGDLGVRLQEFFRAAFSSGAQRVVAIGADCPALSAAFCREAFQKLNTNSAVIGPASDGGYYLIGLSRPELSVFENITWSTSATLEQTLQRTVSAGLTYYLLDKLTDLDELESLPQIEIELQRSTSSRAGEVAAFLQRELVPWLNKGTI